MKEILQNQLDNKFIVNIAVPKPLDQLFTYLVPQDLLPLLKTGGWVQIPFGPSDRLISGCIVENALPISQLSSNSLIDKLKQVHSVEDDSLILPQDVFALCKWAHEYYGSPLGEVLQAAFPASLFETEGQKKRREKKAAKNFALSPMVKTLTIAQMEAFEKLKPLLFGKSKFSTGLLHGVTGSGKTEIYMELAKQALSLKKSVIILVPEIALTPQLHHRFEQGLGIPVGLWHSAVSDQMRRDHYLKLKNGTLRAVVGARSAVFAPVKDLGLIVVDEEHDSTYKQEDRTRYNARDLAVVRGKITGAMVLLGSATPSLETRERVIEGKYALANLDSRISSVGLPSIEVVDLCRSERVPNIRAHLALKTLETLRDTLQSNEQAVLFLNRRGFAAFLVCQDCGQSCYCKNCSLTLSVHRRSCQLKCHVCGYSEHIPDTCAGCFGHRLKPIGAGTESIEDELPLLLPEARILRLDRDQVTSTARLEKILGEFRSGKANILLGTQMLVKGHDFPNVTLVIVILADGLFRTPDFRAPERALQILRQVSGRAGRGTKPGRVLIQTYDPDNRVLKVLLGSSSEESFLETERLQRKNLGYPPFKRLCRVRVESQQSSQAYKESLLIFHAIAPLQSKYGLDILGPSEAFLEKVKGCFRWDMFIKSSDITGIQMVLKTVKAMAPKHKIKFAVDVDPVTIG